MAFEILMSSEAALANVALERLERRSLFWKSRCHGDGSHAGDDRGTGRWQRDASCPPASNITGQGSRSILPRNPR